MDVHFAIRTISEGKLNPDDPQTMILNKNILAVFTTVFSVLISTQRTEAKLTVSECPTPLRAKSIRVGPSEGVQVVPVLRFRIKAEGFAETISKVSVLVEGTALPTTLYLYNGSTLLSSRAHNPAGANFSDLDLEFQSGTYFDLTIKASYSSTTSGWSMTKLVSVTKVSKGELVPIPKITGPKHHFFAGGVADWSLTSTPTIHTATTHSGYTISMTATFVFDVTAIGSNITQPGVEDFVIVAKRGNDVPIKCTSFSVVTIPNNAIADGSTARVVVNASLIANDLSQTGLYGFSVQQIYWGTTASGKVNQSWGLEDFKTPGLINVVVPR